MDQKELQAPCIRPPDGPHSRYFPNVVVITHESRRALFYEDLLRGKTAMIHFLATRDAGAPLLARNLAAVQPYLGDRLGRDVFIYSITTDPLHDTPAVLESFAARFQAQPGWLFLTGDAGAMELLKSRLFAAAVHHHGSQEEDCSLGMLRYGNEAAGLWGTAPINSPPESIAQRISWVASRPAPEAWTFSRRGPAPLSASVLRGGRQ